MTGSLQAKHGKYYVVVRLPDGNGKTKSKWVPTGIEDKPGNKRKAQQKQIEILADLNKRLKEPTADNTPFVDWLDTWLAEKAKEVRENTIEGYKLYAEKHIKPFFEAKGTTLATLTSQDIEEYYKAMTEEGQSPNSIARHKAVISGALKEAHRKKLIPYNPMVDAIAPRRKRFVGKSYSKAEAQQLLKAIDNEPLKPAIILGLYYGLRRSEICGLRWSDIDFEAETVKIRNTVVKTTKLIEHERTKSEASKRTLSLIPETVDYLKKLKRQQDLFRAKPGKDKHPDPQRHVCVHSNGKPFSPDYVSQGFANLLKRHNLPPLRFHELRHTAGSLLIENGRSVKEVQELLGHERASTTLDIYTHLSVEGKKETAKAMGGLFGKI